MHRQIKYYTNEKKRRNDDDSFDDILYNKNNSSFLSEILIAVSLYNSGKEINPLICTHSCLQSASTITIFQFPG